MFAAQEGNGLHRFRMLDLELSALEHAVFNGASGEGVHRTLRWISMQATGSSFRWAASTLRLEQNLAMFDLFREAGLVDRCVDSWMSETSVCTWDQNMSDFLFTRSS